MGAQGHIADTYAMDYTGVIPGRIEQSFLIFCYFKADAC